MKVLLAGATGAIGTPLVAQLVAAGHEVVGLTRSAEKAGKLDAAGARGVICDITDRTQVLRIAEEVAPDVVADETTDLPQRYDTRTMKGFYDGMVDVRLRGTPNLFEAAARTDAHLVFQSIAFAYRPGGNGRLHTEDDELYGSDAPEPWNFAVPAIGALEHRTVGQGGVVLRYGLFYGPGSHLDEGGQFHHDVSRRALPIAGTGGSTYSFIHVDDAARATVAAIERRATGIYNIVDDTPVTLADWVPAYAASLGAKPPRRVPGWLARRVLAPLPRHFVFGLEGTSNAKAKADLDWQPGFPSVHEGFTGVSR